MAYARFLKNKFKQQRALPAAKRPQNKEVIIMAKMTKEFFTDNEVLLIGYSSKNGAFSKIIYQAFMKNGIKVYPLNSKEGGNYDIKVYRSISELPKVPACAYILLNSENTKKAVESLAGSGVRRILFQNKRTVTPETLKKCEEMGIEAAVACPMMILGSGLHRIHAFFAGVR